MHVVQLPQMHTPTTVGAVVAMFLHNTRHEQGRETYSDRARTLEKFASIHGTLGITEAKPYHLRLWIDGQSQWRSDWTRKRAVGSVQRAFNWAVKLGIIDRNPFRGVSHREGDPGRPMTDDEFRAMLRASSAPFRAVLTFLRFTGCRPGELSAIEPCHLDIEQAVAILHKHKTTRTQKVRRPRVIVLHPVALRLVQRLVAAMRPGQRHVFVNARGTPWNRYSLASRIKRVRKMLGLPKDCRLYGLRHKLGTDAILSGVEIKTLSVLMGHTSTRTTERYVHVQGQVAHLGEALQRAIGRRAP